MKIRRGKDERSKIIRALDRITPKIVKLRDAYTCQRCIGMPKGRGLHWSHVYCRRDFLMRWDLLNGLTLCYGCHSFLDSSAREFDDFMEERFPARVRYLRTLRATPRQTIHIETLKLWLDQHEEKLAELESEFKE